MTTSFILALKAEIAQLEVELRSDPRHRKLARLRETLAEYEPASKDLQVQLGSLSIGSLSAGSSAPHRTKEDKVRAEITALLQQRGTVHRNDILRHLIAVGLMGHEKTPMSSLAAYLSYSNNIFNRDGGGNWSLKPVLKAAE